MVGVGVAFVGVWRSGRTFRQRHVEPQRNSGSYLGQGGAGGEHGVRPRPGRAHRNLGVPDDPGKELRRVSPAAGTQSAACAASADRRNELTARRSRLKRAKLRLCRGEFRSTLIPRGDSKWEREKGGTM